MILFIDGHKSHYGLEAADFCKEKQIQCWLLRANMTHLLQPLDLTFFNSLKSNLAKQQHIWQGKHLGENLTKYTVMEEVLYPVTEGILENPSIIINGFKRAGLYPWNPEAPDKIKLLPGSIYTADPIESPHLNVNHDIDLLFPLDKQSVTIPDPMQSLQLPLDNLHSQYESGEMDTSDNVYTD